MNLTLTGFLRKYCRELTGLDTGNLRKLCAAAATSQPGAAEAVMLFAAVQGKSEYLFSLAEGTNLERPYAVACEDMSRFDDIESWLKSGSAPSRYEKVWSAYLSEKGAIGNDRRVILLMRDKTMEAMEAAGVTAYRLCKELGLNLGNVYAYLGKGDATKVSRSTARRLMECALSHVPSCL